MSVRQLPIVSRFGKKYYVDERLGEMRAVDDPYDVKPLSYSEDYIPAVEKGYSMKPYFYESDMFCWASHGKEGDIARLSCELDTGQQVQFFLNREDGLVVVDVVDADGQRGREILRKRVI